MVNKEVPNIVIGRLPLYLRALQHMAKHNRRLTSSQELGERLGISAAQIRKDLSQFGEFGKQGTGYQIAFLIEQISKILHIDRAWDIALVGSGGMGHAVARYQGFANRGFQVAMVFDNDPAKIGQKVGQFVIQDVALLIPEIRKANIRFAMLAVPASQAQAVTDQLVEAGVKAILNYAPISLNVPAGVKVQYIDPAVHLQIMAYYIK